MANVSSVTTGFFPETQEGFTTTTSGTVASGAATVGLNSVAGYTNGASVALVIEPTSTTAKQVFTGVVDTAGIQITGVKWTEGTNTTHAAGVTVVDYETATAWNLQRKGFRVEHNSDGTHGAVTATSLNGVTLSGVGLFSQSVQYTTSGTYSKPANLKFVIVEVIGGGGAGGGAVATAASEASVGAGAGGGGYARSKILASTLATTETVTVGTGGVAVSGGTGGNGTSSSFGTYAVAGAGSGGGVASNTTGSGISASEGLGGIPTAGDIQIRGGSGFATVIVSGVGLPGIGGSSVLGYGGWQVATNAAGATGQNYGGGGAGARNGGVSVARAGGAGAPGIVIVNEYY